MLFAASPNRMTPDALVKRHQPPTVRDSQCKQVNVCNLLMPLQAVAVEHGCVRYGNIVRPKRMVAAPLCGFQAAEHKGGRLRNGVARICHHAQAPVFCQRASRPSARAVRQKPAVRVPVPYVFLVEQRHQEIHVEQGPLQIPSSSQICWTSSTVTGGPPRLGNGWTPVWR